MSQNQRKELSALFEALRLTPEGTTSLTVRMIQDALQEGTEGQAKVKELVEEARRKSREAEPPIPPMPAEELSGIVKILGGRVAASRALETSTKRLRIYCTGDEPVPPEIAQRARELERFRPRLRCRVVVK